MEIVPSVPSPRRANSIIAPAKKAGVYRGRKRVLTPERAKELRDRIKAGEKKAAVARDFGISRETLYSYL